MRYFICVMLLCGCAGEQFQVETVTPDAFTVTVQSIETKQDQTLTALAAIKSQVESLSGSILETRQAVGTMEAKLIVPKPQREEVIKSAREPQEPTRPNLSQPVKPVALAPAVRSSGPLKLSWNVEGNWNPSILETAKHLREDHGIIADGMSHQQMHDMHAAIHEGRQVATKSPPVQLINRGSSCPGGQCPTVRTRRRR